MLYCTHSTDIYSLLDCNTIYNDVVQTLLLLIGVVTSGGGATGTGGGATGTGGGASVGGASGGAGVFSK